MGPYVHETLTRRWAIDEGLSTQADDIAQANVDFDRRFPGRLPVFWGLHLGPMAAAVGVARLWLGMGLRSPRIFGWGLHGVQDYLSHGWLGEKHLLLRLGVARRHPDVWDDAPESVKRRIERTSRRWLRRYSSRLARD